MVGQDGLVGLAHLLTLQVYQLDSVERAKSSGSITRKKYFINKRNPTVMLPLQYGRKVKIIFLFFFFGYQSPLTQNLIT